LGLDFWKTRKVWISYRNALMFVSDGRAAMALAYPVTDAAPTSAGAGAKGDPGSN
jgi:hypothetical protein